MTHKFYSSCEQLCENTRSLLRKFDKYCSELDEDNDKKSINELSNFIRFYKQNHDKSKAVDVDRMKVLLSLLYLPDDDINKIVSFIESTGYGWQDDKYVLSNPCLAGHPTDHCKMFQSYSDIKTALDRLQRLSSIFLDEKYGQTTLFLFCYCLAALFSKRLSKESFLPPYYLQISCERSSVLFQLIEEIAEICDVNSGLTDRCLTATQRSCWHRSQIYYPSQSVKNDIDYLISENSDVPIIVDGSENLTYYNNLLRSIANIPNSRTNLALKDKFNVLPVFVCPTIKSTFGNVFSIELADLDVSTDYLEFVRNNKQLLASCVLKFVQESDCHLFSGVNEHIRPNHHPFKTRITNIANSVRKHYPNLSFSNAKNIGFLSFFFMGFIHAFQSAFVFPLETAVYTDRNKNPITMGRFLDILIQKSEQQLLHLHLRCYPAPRSKGIQNKESLQLSRQIEKHYNELHVSIRVTPIEVKNDRYIFSIETLQKTKDSDITSNRETVQHRLKNYECFRFDMTDGREIRLIVAKSQLQDNNLLDFLKHKEFSASSKELPYAIGVEENGNPYFEDIAEFPHLLIGGCTNSGKSTAIRSLLLSIAYKHRTGNASVVIIDLLNKISESEFSIFNGHPIMAYPVIQDPFKAAKVILALRDVTNNRPRDRPAQEVPHIVCVIDEFPTLYNDLNKKCVEQVKSAMSELLSKGRHTNVHLVLAAQDPSKDSVGNVSNIKARMAFRCSHYKYSTNIIGHGGAEKLLGKGQMIFESDHAHNMRLLGSYIDTKEMKKLLNETKANFMPENLHRFTLSDADLNSVSFDDSSSDSKCSTEALPKESRFKTFDELLPKAIMWTLPQAKVANSRLLDYLHVRNAMGKEILEWMSEHRLVTRLNGNHGWKVEPEPYDALDEEVIRVLTDAGYTECEIKAELGKKS